MTLKELHGEICALGFDDFLPLDARFHSSVCRAMRGIYNAVEITEMTKFFVRSSLPSSKISEFHHEGGRTDILPLCGKALSMRIYGQGVFRVTGANVASQKSFNSDGDIFRYFINGDARLILLGDLPFTVCDIAIYDEVFSSDVESIPDGSGYTTVNIQRKVSDFLTFNSMPRDQAGNIIECAALHDGKITFGPEFVGEAELSYRRAPVLPSLDAPDVKIDLPTELYLLLSLLTASYLLLDDDSDKAAYYKSLYDAELTRVKAVRQNPSSDKYVITDGWA